MERSIAGQVEFWARLGKVMDRLLSGEDVMKLRGSGAGMKLSQCIEIVNQPRGRQRLEHYLASRPFPRFIADPHELRGFIREDADGSRTRGTIVGRDFVPTQEGSGQELA
jgi:hypothetical protein